MTSGSSPLVCKQFELLGMETSKGASVFADPAFSANKALPIHRWVPWIAGFSRDFVSDALTRYLTDPGTVLDPFAGVGTTLVESVLHGHNAIGFEINPYAASASELKANAHLINVESLRQESMRFQSFYSNALTSGYMPHSSSPPGFHTRSAFYGHKVLRKVLTVWDFMETVSDKRIKDVFRLVFAATMVRYSNYSYEPSLGRRAGVGKPEIDDFPVGEVVSAKLIEILQDLTKVKDLLPSDDIPRARVICDSFFGYEEHIGAASVDLIITSPPYLNNYHYIRNTRPQLYWLGYAQKPGDLKALEESNFGKYWQTVRDGRRIDLQFSLPDTDLAERLQALRNTNHARRTYGGAGWANYAAAYFNDCRRFALGVKYALKPGATALVVVGNSILQGIPIPTDLYLGKIAESVGLELARIDIPRATRVGNSIIHSKVRASKAGDDHSLYEAIVELRNH